MVEQFLGYMPRSSKAGSWHWTIMFSVKPLNWLSMWLYKFALSAGMQECPACSKNPCQHVLSLQDFFYLSHTDGYNMESQRFCFYFLFPDHYELWTFIEVLLCHLRFHCWEFCLALYPIFKLGYLSCWYVVSCLSPLILDTSPSSSLFPIFSFNRFVLMDLCWGPLFTLSGVFAR